MAATEGSYYQDGAGPPYGKIYLIQSGRARLITDWATYQSLRGGAGNPAWGMWWNGTSWLTPQGTPGTPNPGWNLGTLPAGTPIGAPIASLVDAATITPPAITPPGAPGPNPVWPTFTSNPFGTPSAPGSSSGSLSRPTKYFGVTLPLWGWGAVAFGAYHMFGRRRR